jgi:hypothetical protein
LFHHANIDPKRSQRLWIINLPQLSLASFNEKPERYTAIRETPLA